MLCTNRRCPPGAVQERPPRQENTGSRRSNGASVPAVPAVPSRSEGPFAAAHLPPRTEAHADSERLGRSAVNGTVCAAANQRPTGEGAGSGCGCGGCSRMQGPQRSPQPGPQPGGAVPRRRRPRTPATRTRADRLVGDRRRVGATVSLRLIIIHVGSKGPPLQGNLPEKGSAVGGESPSRASLRRSGFGIFSG